MPKSPAAQLTLEKAGRKQLGAQAARLQIQAQPARNTRAARQISIHTAAQEAEAISAEAQAAIKATSWAEAEEEAAMRLAAS
jgi:hypothetical protein